MKTGLQWNASPEKRMFDVTVATALLPAERAARLVVKSLIARSCPRRMDGVEKQERIGLSEQPFDLFKYRAVDLETGEVFGNWAAYMQKLGLDEIAQLENIRLGQMGLVGRRPIVKEEHDEVMDNLPPRLGMAWQAVAKCYIPGIISSYGLDSHVRGVPDANDYERRAELDIRDARSTSLVYDSQLIRQFAGLAIARRFQ